MRKIILICGLILLICRYGAANPVMISGIGEVELGPDIVMTEGHDKQGELVYNFRVKDGEVWRGAMLMPLKDIPFNGVGDMIKTDVFLNKVIEEKISKDENVLSTEKAKRIMVGGKECATAAVKMGIPEGAIIANLDMTMVSGSNGIRIFCYMCADSDAEYWKPVMQKILAMIP